MSETAPQPEGPWMQRPELLGRPSHRKRIKLPAVAMALDDKYGSENWRFQPNNQGIGHVEIFVKNRGSEEKE